jgi:hypothetical protein
MDIVTLPLLLGSAPFSQAFEVMNNRRVSACVVQVGNDSFLLGLNKVVEIGREWATLPASLDFVVTSRSLLKVEPSLEYSGGGENWLDQQATRFALLDSGIDFARVVTRFERLGGALTATPVTYECDGTPTHRWTAQDLNGAKVCPHLTHPDPRPGLHLI